MRVSRHKNRLLYFLLLTLLTIPITARADDDEQDDDYDVKARVVRVSLLGGEVNLKRNGNQDWEPARMNYPLVEGDTIATSKDSNLEIQIDARNFVRLAANSVLRIITLRDEGIAISVVEGTAMVRLAKFDRSKNGYFEIDAPKTTMAAEKDGLYRIDVPRDGRVRLTVRDGGSARIYSDTSGFTLRDGRSAELVVTGENAGDWEFVAAAPSDAIDALVSDRERELARRLKYDVKYFDESVWGGEDLEAYGDWTQTDEFGWIWRPHTSVISSYNDWAPYRYGSWTWCPPYGWTWIGDEPWGWAPYHYGRWVYVNNYWAWAPRSQYVRKRSWWRPALVAFVVDFSFGNDVCWYPLSYYQRDPHSRHYRRDDRYRDRDRDRRDGRHDYRDPRGVTRQPRRDFGNPERRGQPVDQPIARRIIDLDPERGDGDLPRRERWGRGPRVEIPERRTGAADRAPGASLDDNLRRNRVFRGREPRPRDVAQPAASTPATAPATNAETQPSGAVARPEPRPRRNREPRPERPDGSERRGRRPENTEAAPTSAPEPRSEQPAQVSEPPRETPRENPRVERREREPVPDSRPRSEPRSEPRESRPAPRSESPRSESPRQESPRSEAPRSQPSRSESPRQESPRQESPRSESPRSEAPRSDPPRSESPRSESPRSEPPRSESPRTAPDKPDRPLL